ncbi:hypothetical protein VNO77_43762 [Canavalia gladiata]|uniref:Uncharacterized protein n=1 Tax=Canavalia gladiata TaxID=3824 RepID=A0AAN9JUQ1_CANGL
MKCTFGATEVGLVLPRVEELVLWSNQSLQSVKVNKSLLLGKVATKIGENGSHLRKIGTNSTMCVMARYTLAHTGILEWNDENSRWAICYKPIFLG